MAAHVFLKSFFKTKNNLISRKIRDNKRGSGVVAMDSGEQQIHSTDNSAYCKQCESGTVMFDMVLTEFVCSSCGCVLDDRILHFDGAVGAANLSEYSDGTSTGMPESLAMYHKDLSTLIGVDDTDATGKVLEPSQKMRCRGSAPGTVGRSSTTQSLVT